MPAALRAGTTFLLFSLLLSGCGRDEAKDPSTVYVTDTVVERETVSAASTFTGEVEPVQQSDLSFKVAGQIVAIRVDVGDRVRPGQVLAEIDDRQQTADLEIAEAGLHSAEAELAQAEASAARQRSLVEKGAVPQSSLEQAEQQLTSAQNSVVTAKSERASARKDLADTRIIAGVAGLVLDRQSDVGAVVSAGQAVLTLARGDEKQAIFEVPEVVMMVPDPLAIAVEVALLQDGERSVTGRITDVSPAVDLETGTVTVKVSLPGEAAEFPLGAPVSGRFGRHQQVGVILPWTALTQTTDGPAVWVVDKDTCEVATRPVTLGDYEDRTFQVLSGLEVGDTVVTKGGKLLRPGLKVAEAEDAR